jgi:hypothetical protein
LKKLKMIKWQAYGITSEFTSSRNIGEVEYFTMIEY